MAADPRDGAHPVAAADLGGMPWDRLDRVLKRLRPTFSWSQLRDLVARGKVALDGVPCRDDSQQVRAGQQLEVRMSGFQGAPGAMPAAVPVPALDDACIVHLDRHVVVVDKPAGLNTVPWEDQPDALDARLAARLGTRPGVGVRVVHRLDRDTSGLLVFARTEEAEGRLAHQLRRHAMHRRYLALAHGRVEPRTIRSFLADDRGDGLRGSVANPRLGKEAVTHVEVVEHLAAATLVACRLETGRTHQIRIHLAEAGHMLLGERGYVREHRGTALSAPRILLHAAELGFVHPEHGNELRFACALPADFTAALDSLRKAPRGA